MVPYRRANDNNVERLPDKIPCFGNPVQHRMTYALQLAHKPFYICIDQVIPFLGIRAGNRAWKASARTCYKDIGRRLPGRNALGYTGVGRTSLSYIAREDAAARISSTIFY